MEPSRTDHHLAVWRCVSCRGFIVLPATGQVSYKIRHPPPGERWGGAVNPEPHHIVCLGHREVVDRPDVVAAYTLGGPEAVSVMQDPPD